MWGYIPIPSLLETKVMAAFEDWEWFEPLDYYNDFVKFVNLVQSGRFLIIITIDYGLPVGFETLTETLTIWSSPQHLTFPLDECFKRSVEPFIKSSLRRFEDPILTGLSFKWCNVDGICATTLAQSGEYSNSC